MLKPILAIVIGSTRLGPRRPQVRGVVPWARDRPWFLRYRIYGGVAAGTRAVQQLKQVVTALKMVSVAESVNIPFFSQFINEAGDIRPSDSMTHVADAMLNELLRITTLLRPQVAEVSEASDAMVLVR